MKDIRKKHEAQVEKLKDKFNEAVKKRQERAWFDVFLSAFNALIGIFSGNLSGISALSQLKEKIKKIAKLIERLTLIIGTLSGLVNLGGNVEKTIHEAQAGYGADITTVKPKQIDYEKLSTTSKYSDPSQVNTIVDQMSKLDAADVLQWVEAEKEIQGNLDASVTQEVPGGKDYKKALLQLNAAGKAETEAAIKYAQLKSEIYLNRYRIRAYEEETEYTANALMNFKNVEIDDYKKNIQLTKEQLKLDLFLHLIDYCDASLYYNLKPCIVFSEFSFDASVPHTVYITNKISIESINSMNDLFPPPQSFQDISIKINAEQHCDKIVSHVDKIYESDPCFPKVTLECENAVFEEMRELYTQLNIKFPTIKSEKTLDKDTQNLGFKGKYFACTLSNIEEMKKNNSTTISIELEDEAFKGFNRVRISEMKMFLEGVT